MPRFVPLAAIIAVLGLGVAACGGSSSSSSSAATSSAPAASPSTSSASSAASPSTSSTSPAAAAAGGSSPVAVKADPSGQLKFDATSLTATTGTVQIAFTNRASVGHNFTLQKGTSGPVVGATPTFSGATKTLSVKLAPGTYTYFCSVPGHRMAGMQGTLTVK